MAPGETNKFGTPREFYLSHMPNSLDTNRIEQNKSCARVWLCERQCSMEPRREIWSVVCARYSRTLLIAIVGLLRNTMVCFTKQKCN